MKTVQGFRSKSTPQDLDVLDRGDHLKVTSCTRETAAWWLGTLRAVYPQDHYSGTGDNIKMHPEVGVTLKLNKSDGTLTIKGRKHMQWFRENFESVVAAGSKEFSANAEFTKTVDSYLKLNDGYAVSIALPLSIRPARTRTIILCTCTAEFKCFCRFDCMFTSVVDNSLID